MPLEEGVERLGSGRNETLGFDQLVVQALG